ncbi:MAG: hypothetical protein A3F41_06340 [Coxiella sp. RIFCSPHIGHO2_12_FULL_44_14]|nr:MAG: hypothetical protein A3F41_06340 [Coxiella sp. RIFCSPHIGHO2_12_FULL_44_14]
MDEELIATLKTEEALYRAYMPFVNKGGIFIPTENNISLGDKVKVSLLLPNEKEPIVFIGKVIWITPKSANESHRTPGIGVELRGVEGMRARKKIELLLKNRLGSHQPTETL